MGWTPFLPFGSLERRLVERGRVFENRPLVDSRLPLGYVSGSHATEPPAFDLIKSISALPLHELRHPDFAAVLPQE
jgi:hypothetical protein